jgi:hypothetical protein
MLWRRTMKKRPATIEAVSIYCPKKKRNVRLPWNCLTWDTNYFYGSVSLIADICCSCGEIHRIEGVANVGTANLPMENIE